MGTHAATESVDWSTGAWKPERCLYIYECSIDTGRALRAFLDVSRPGKNEMQAFLERVLLQPYSL